MKNERTAFLSPILIRTVLGNTTLLAHPPPAGQESRSLRPLEERLLLTRLTI